MLIAGVTGWAAVATAQEDLPQINPGERKIPRKKDEGPRALALLKLTADGKASLLPITILINGKFWDATAYKADPVPMALDSGTVYEAERTGSSLGLFTVATALHSKATNVLSPWIGTGAWAPAGSEKANTEHAAESVPVGIDTSDQPPRLTKDPSRLHLPEETSPSSSSTKPTPAPSSPGASSDEPPRLSKPSAPSSPPSSPSPSSAPSGGSNPPGSSAPAPGAAPVGSSSPSASQSKAGDTKAEAKTPESDSGASDANRPRLRRGKPTAPLPDEEVAGYGKPGAEPAAGAAGASPAPANEGQFQLIPAISDAKGPEPRPFTFEWLKDEEGERRQQLTTMAKDELRAYLDAQAKARIAPIATTTPKTTRHTPPAKPPEPILENVRMNAYDLWVSNQPVIVFSAEAHVPATPTPSGQATPESNLQYSILLVAYPDIYNNLRKLYVGVTDKYHLDITPKLQLVDAVDADGDGRGELLFRETSDAGAGWVIYRATADKLWKMFDSLNPE